MRKAVRRDKILALLLSLIWQLVSIPYANSHPADHPQQYPKQESNLLSSRKASLVSLSSSYALHADRTTSENCKNSGGSRSSKNGPGFAFFLQDDFHETPEAGGTPLFKQLSKLWLLNRRLII